MHHIFQRFIDLLSTAEDSADFHEAIAVTAGALDLSCFAYLHSAVDAERDDPAEMDIDSESVLQRDRGVS